MLKNHVVVQYQWQKVSPFLSLFLFSMIAAIYGQEICYLSSSFCLNFFYLFLKLLVCFNEEMVTPKHMCIIQEGPSQKEKETEINVSD